MKIYETSKDTERRICEVAQEDRIYAKKAVVSNYLNIDTTKTFQTFKGFGGALTESSGYVLSFLDEKARKEVMESFYSEKNGNGYVYARTHLNSCDFSLENWSCLPEKTDDITKFDMTRPEKYILPILKEAKEQAGDDLKVIVTPWSPSAWMKSNNDMNHGGKLLEEYRTIWAKCYVRYIQELNQRGINVDYVSVQNEPAAVQTWDSCEYSGKEEAEFAVNSLYPEFKAASLEATKILVWDHNRDVLKERVDDSMSVPGADKVVAGAAYHWYSGDQYENVAYVAKKYPQLELIFTEGCVEQGPRNGKWFTGERYAHNIINDLNAGCNAWVDWNIALDMEGGPNHVGNFCDAPVLVDTEKKTVNYQSSYYYIGHFSRFIKPGAVRVHSEVSSWMLPTTADGKLGNMVESCAFKNPDGSLVVVLCNRTEDDVNYEMTLDGEKSLRFIPARSIQTFVI